MPRFFVSPGQIGIRDNGEKTVMISGDDAVHITKSLRMKPGESITVCDTDGVEYDCEIVSVGEVVIADVKDSRLSGGEPPYKAVLYQALIKGDKFDTVVQKAVESGVSVIYPVLTSRCVVRLDKKDCLKKISRWQRIADEAAKQCGRGSLVRIGELMTFREAVADAAAADVSLFCYEEESAVSLKGILSENGSPGTVSVMIGSEGGFSPEEASYAKDAGMKSVGLGNRILRTETSSSFVLACLSYEYEMSK